MTKEKDFKWKIFAGDDKDYIIPMSYKLRLSVTYICIFWVFLVLFLGIWRLL